MLATTKHSKYLLNNCKHIYVITQNRSTIQNSQQYRCKSANKHINDFKQTTYTSVKYSILQTLIVKSILNIYIPTEKRKIMPPT